MGDDPRPHAASDRDVPDRAARGVDFEWPAQIVLGASQVYWTQDVHHAIADNGNDGLKEYVERLNTQLDKVVLLVRGNLTKLERTTIGALVVIDVHARDTIAHMIQKGVETDQDFE